ncbi:Protein ABHD16A [Hondaea fermentalgiana]|uniref:Protein ABHD16A n=1 Tax=Hondaea fermentalgiana TaxID=2315210 RepID=A0A2R5GG43_9STRA|nr:Protein ABHD16A [Hondaea fermentalgiana]|eukprot:GBG28738.1 Protein ABHD16A [Hondaea fermentalgiana]
MISIVFGIFAVAGNPRRVALVYVGLNAVFVGIGEVVVLLVWLLTLPGFLVLLLVGIFALVYNVARLIVYPGMIPNVQRGLERELAREVRRNVLQNLEPHVNLLKLLVYVHQSLHLGGQGLSVIWLKERLTELSRQRMQASMSTVEPTLATLRSLQNDKKDHKLLHGGEDVLEALSQVSDLDALLEELVVSPALHALQTHGIGAFAAAIAPSVETLGHNMHLVPAVDSAVDLPAIQPSHRPEAELRDAPWLVLADLAAAIKTCAERTVFFEEIKEAPLKVLPNQVSPGDIELGIRVRKDSDATSSDSDRTRDACESDSEFDVGSPASSHAGGVVEGIKSSSETGGGDSEQEGDDGPAGAALAAVAAAARAAGTSAAAATAAAKAKENQKTTDGIRADGKKHQASAAAAANVEGGDVESIDEEEEEEEEAQAVVKSAAEGGTLALSGGKLGLLLEEFRSARRPMLAIANLEFMRFGLQTRFKGEQAWVSSYQGVHIDTMFLPAKHAKFAADQRTIIVCNPNCGYYEFAAMQNQWAHFYTDLGFNVLLFNYRGYGRSEGWPRPYALQRDGEVLVEYLTRRKGVKRGWIGVHAESIGGVVACHLARHAMRLGISFMVADRTLCDLPSVAANMIGNWAAIAIQGIGWYADNASGFLAAPNSLYRVCTCDPNDEIIANNASLKSGVARRIVAAACYPMPTAANEEQRIAIVASTLLGAPRDRESFDFLWLRDPAFSSAFALATVQMLEAQRELSLLPPLTSNRALASLLHAAVHVLWYTDGYCGESLGSPLSRFYQEWRNFQRPAQATPEHVQNLIKKASIKWVVPLQDWLANLFVWGQDAPPVKDLVSPKDIAQARRAIYSIKGRRVVCGALHPVPFATTVEIYQSLKDDALLQGAALDTDIAAAINAISTALSKIQDMRSKVMAHRGGDPVAQTPAHIADDATEIGIEPVRPAMFLLPLNCGHNGRIGPPGLRQMRNHLLRAGWLPATS